MAEEIFLSVIIPAFNEEKRLPKTLEKIDNYLKNQSYQYEILVVNDGSRDGTAKIVRDLESKIKNLRLIDNKENRGKGYVVRQGMLAAQGIFRLFTDADNSTSIEQVEKMFPYFEEGYDIVIGSRRVKGAILDPPQPFYRQILGEIFAFLTHILIGTWEIKDSQCGFKGFTKKVVQDVFPRCRIDRFAFDPEILIVARKRGYKIKEMPVLWRNDPESKVKFNSMVKMAIDLLKIRWNIIKKVYD
jgi:dolichyl-phosphate beta-glucosyltransferase